MFENHFQKVSFFNNLGETFGCYFQRQWTFKSCCVVLGFFVSLSFRSGSLQIVSSRVIFRSSVMCSFVMPAPCPTWQMISFIKAHITQLHCLRTTFDWRRNVHITSKKKWPKCTRFTSPCDYLNRLSALLFKEFSSFVHSFTKSKNHQKCLARLRIAKLL